jgi:oligoribonuclease NrnB/cAMP/cGMP phosphodiesterase (DHH superfamily)
MPLLDEGVDAENFDLLDAINNRTTHLIHLTHNDLDAVGADAIHRMKYGNDGVFTIWSSVGAFSELFSLVACCEGKGDLLSISDLGYRPQSESIASKAKENGWDIEWRDHHRWRDDEIKKIERIVSLLHIDTSVCATGIVARDFVPDNPIAADVARVVCDYDLWKQADPRSAILGLVLQRNENFIHVRDCLIAGIFSDSLIAKEYVEIKTEMDAMMQRSLNQAIFLGKKYKIAFAPLYSYPSETAHFIRDKRNTDIEVIFKNDGRFSVRSVLPISHILAREFGGGGHPNAAGGSFNFSLMERFMWLRKKNWRFDDFVKVAEGN